MKTDSKGKRYFSHDADAHNDPSIAQLLAVHGWQGYGWYWRIVEQLTSEESHTLNMESKYFYEGIGRMLSVRSTDAERFISDCVNEFKLFNSDGKLLWSNSHLERMKLVDSKSESAQRSAYQSLIARKLTSLSYEEWLSERSANAPTNAKRSLSNININLNRNINNSNSKRKKIKNSDFLFNELLSSEERSKELEWQNHEYFLDQTFYETWNEYMTVRDEKKIPAWSPTQLKAQWNKLKKYSDGNLKRAVTIVTAARDGAWKGLWQVEEDKKTRGFAKQVSGRVNAEYERTLQQIKDEHEGA